MDKGLLNYISLEEIKESPSLPIGHRVGKDIAIIGMSLQLPNAKTVEEFWEEIKNGGDMITRIPEERKRIVEMYGGDIGFENEITYEEAAYLEEIDTFDYEYFHLSPGEASVMDPNQRIFLETAWRTIEDAGYGGDRIRGTRTGVFVGFSNEMEYKKMIERVNPSLLSIAIPGNLPPMIASRISYLLDLKGPNMRRRRHLRRQSKSRRRGCYPLRGP